MKRTQLRHMLAVVARVVTALLVLSAAILGPFRSLSAVGFTNHSTNSDVLKNVELRASERFASESYLEVNQLGTDITFINKTDTWLFGNVTVYPLDEGSEVYAGPYLFLARKVGDSWIIGLENDSAFLEMVGSVPKDLVGREFQQILLQLAQSTPQDDSQHRVLGDGSAQLSLPWAKGESRILTQGPHPNAGGQTGTRSSLDLSGSWLASATAAGTAYKFCDTGVRIMHAGGWATRYHHLKDISVSASGTPVQSGDSIGTSFVGSMGNCGGYTTGAHLHISIYKDGSEYAINGVDIGGWTISNGDGYWYDNKYYWHGCLSKGTIRACDYDGSIYNDGTAGSGNTPPAPTCPTSGDVILYYDANYNCAGKGENNGYVIRNGTGWQNMPGGMNDQASSIRVRSGWSVKLFEHGDRGGGSACRNGNDDTFWGDTFNNGVGLNDKVSSFEVFSTPNCGENHAPNRPSPSSPGDWHVQRDGRAPTLCWNNNNDPDGDQVEFYAEVFGSARNANSGWTRSTCWRPGDLDGYYFNYQWRVKARDGKPNGESDWSQETRHFTIEAPNAPPTISFNTANGSGAGSIDSRDRNWTFLGKAHDDENLLDRVEFRCSGDTCNATDRASRTGNNRDADWNYTRNDIAGQNDIYFVAFDDRQSTASRHLDLRVDLTAPATTLSLNNDANPANWPAWFTGAVEVRLHADDGATGRARSGVKEVRYRLDGGGWQTQGGSDAAFTVTGDGSHTVEYYAVDNVGNTEGGRTAPFRVDRTPPSPPSGIVETHGVPNGQWQKTQNVASFTWAAASDATSGLWGYQFYFGDDPAGTSNQAFLAADPRQWTPQPGGVRTGTYYLRGRTRDLAGNWSAWTDLFTFRYDGTPPENPTGATHALGANVVRNDVWQRATSLADFTWPAPSDEGSGVKGYSVYWGADAAGAATSFITANRYQSSAPLCDVNAACTGYLRLRSRDNVDNEPAGWSTAFVLRYDNAPPVADFTFSQGVTTTQTLVNLKIAATDQGSGLREMRLSGDGQAWTPWEVYAAERPWEIPGISRQSWPVYLQVKDGVGLTSAVISHTIYLDVNPQQPRSAGFRLFDYAMSAGGGDHASAGYSGRSTVGQVVDSAVVTSTGYILAGGYQAGSRAIPIQEPGHDEFEFVNGIFASGSGASTLTSVGFRMVGTLGEIGVPNNETTLASQRHQLQPGFLAAAPRANATPTPTPTPGPTPTPSPTPACEFPRISINNAAVFTTNPNVTLSICAPNAREMKISNDGGFGDAQWEPYAASKAWTLTTYGNYVLPRFVYAAFREANGTIRETYMDDIIIDPNPPTGTIAAGDGLALAGSLAASGASHGESRDAKAAVIRIGGAKYLQRLGGMALAQPLALLAPRSDGAVDLYVTAKDEVSGVAEMQISANGVFSDTTWEPYSALKPWTPAGGDGEKTVYARFRDSAGNISALADTRFALDTIPPIGGVALDRHVAGPDTMSLRVYLGAEDNLSGVADMRVSLDGAFTNAPWLPYTVTLTWPVSLTATSSGTLYVQYRDEVGNVSETYSDAYVVDTTPPVVYVEVAAGETLTRPVSIFAYDELADLATLRLSNDPLLIEGVITQPYTPTVGWAFDARRVVWAQVKDSVGNWSEPYPAYAAPNVQMIGLTPQWNLISLRREPPSVQITDVLRSISGRYCQVLGEHGIYDCTLAPTYHTLRELHAGAGYYLKLDDNAANLSVSGATLPVTTPLALHAGWNWIGYLPETELPITTALSSITGRYDLVLSLDEVFDPADPGSSGLLTLQPGQGYLIRATSPATLTYPAGVSLAVSIGQATDAQTCPALSPTPYRTLLRGKLTFGGVSAPAGTRVEIITPRGELGGCTVTRQAGQYGYVQVYGEDASAPPLPGFREGEPLAFRVNGVSVVPQTSIAWHNDLSVHAVDLTAGGSKVYLPLIVR